MQLDGVLGDTLLGQEVLNLNPLVTLELDDLASLLVLNKGAIASEFLSDRTTSVFGWMCGNGHANLLESLEELPGIVFWTSETAIRFLTKVGTVLKRAHLWGDLAKWSTSCGHFAVGYGYGCSSAEFLLLHY